mgnify:FL=1
MSERYILIKALQTKDSLIPFWELEYQHSEMYGCGFRHTNTSGSFHYTRLVEVLWDMKATSIKASISKDYYSETKFAVGDKVVVEKDSYSSYEDTITKVVFTEFESMFYKAKDLAEHGSFRSLFTAAELSEPNIVVEVKCWKSFYKLACGQVIEWEHKLKKKVEAPKK